MSENSVTPPTVPPKQRPTGVAGPDPNEKFFFLSEENVSQLRIGQPTVMSNVVITGLRAGQPHIVWFQRPLGDPTAWAYATVLVLMLKPTEGEFGDVTLAPPRRQ